jgi:hypothetical protein
MPAGSVAVEIPILIVLAVLILVVSAYILLGRSGTCMRARYVSQPAGSDLAEVASGLIYLLQSDSIG